MTTCCYSADNSATLEQLFKRKTGADIEDAPALDKIPTNQFIDNFIHDADGDWSEDEFKSPIVGRSLGERKPSEVKPMVKVEPLPEEADDLETIIDVEETPFRYDDTGQLAYQRACKKFDTLPCSSFYRQLGDATHADISHYNFGSRGAKAIAVPMLINSKITSLKLKGNDISATGMEYICRMMTENTYVTDLDISDNNLKTHGARLIVEMLKDNQSIRWLDLSGNNFHDGDAAILCPAIEASPGYGLFIRKTRNLMCSLCNKLANQINRPEQPNLRYINLSHNNFGETSGPAFRKMISENNILDELDLSWNQIRMKGALDIAKGVKENVGMKRLNLSWNGFGEDGGKEIAISLKTSSLQELDLTSTRINAEGFLAIVKAFKENDDLTQLLLRKNPIQEEAARAGMDFLLTLDELHLTLLDLGDCMYSSSFKDKVEEVREKHESFNCPFGYTDSYGKRKLKQYNIVQEALGAMNKYCQEHGINIVELFSRFDADGSMSVTHDEFKQGLREAKIPLTDFQIDELIKSLDDDGDGEIDFGEMVMGAERYKED